MNQHVGSQVRRREEGLRTEGAFKCAFQFFVLVRVLLSRPPDCFLRRRGDLFAGLITGRGDFVQSVLAAVCLHVLSKGKFFATFRAAEGFLACVQILMLMEEAAVLKSLATDVAHVRAHVVRVLATVVFHD